MPRDLELALDGILRVRLDGAYADLWLRGLRERHVGAPYVALVERRVLGVLERWYNLEAVLETVLTQPFAALPPVVQAILALAAWRLRFEDKAPDYAVVSTAVEQLEQRGARWAKGVGNAALRRLSREGTAPWESVWAQSDAARWALPEWWARALLPVCTQQELDMVLAGLRLDPGIFVHDAAGGAAAQRLSALDAALVPTPLAAVVRVSGGASALWQQESPLAPGVLVQDLGVAAALLAVKPLLRAPLWDAFCAPGGKLRAVRAWGVAPAVGSDRSEVRLGLVRKADPEAFLVAADAMRPPWPQSMRFATIIADVPCTASGTIGRHPDVVLRLSEHDVARMAQLQAAWVRALTPWVAAGGLLLYATCSLFPAENEDVVEAFLAEHPDWTRQTLRHPFDSVETQVLRMWPHRHGTAGFVMQVLRAP